ncbi:hypothetical protein M6B22_07005 [Jatrophihabitans cynanchi]|uniref:MinD-like ATPase involved in chromosome partitioning or flagellar assembly n=1 Tax=Jatrophihabitans cynanchi TaxID=2944128 RepID=A0ABY7K2S8_9ACTN|nr:hypothetical protein [Jatrophihabitans sp. SB3-54]WAX58505.1 hypothetical protein M6B22_07005 [Jatrophihabitans sp. SB3-54]
MSPQPLAEDLDELEDRDAAKSRTAPDAAVAPATIRQRVATRDLLAAIQQARRAAGLHDAAAAHPPVGDGEAYGIRAAQRHDPLEGNAPVAPPSPVANALATDLPTRPTSPPDPPEPWLPERDGPVSLAGVAAPRTHIRTGQAVAAPDKAARRPARERKQSPPARTRVLDPGMTATAAGAPPRLIVVAACGGAGATTLAVLVAAALAATPSAVLVTAGSDRGALSGRCNAVGGDLVALAEWTSQHPRVGLQPSTPGMSSGDVGTGPMVLAAPNRELGGAHLDAATAAAVLAAAATTTAAVLVDWRCPLPLPDEFWPIATHVLVVAPFTTLGLLDAEYAVQAVESAAPAGGAALSVAAVDVRGGGPRRGRAALARLRALGVSVTSVPHDPALADDPQVHWPALRPRTRAAVTAVLTHVLAAGPTHHLTSEGNAP